MVAEIGRDVDFTWGGQPILGVREKSLNANGEAINVTSDEDGGWQTILAEAGENAVEISLSGVTKDEILKTDWYDGTRTRVATFTWPNGSTLVGSFFLVNFNEGIAYNDAVTFECTLQSNGQPVFTPYA